MLFLPLSWHRQGDLGDVAQPVLCIIPEPLCDALAYACFLGMTVSD